MKKIKKLKKAFTLVELVVVIAIIAILSGVSVAIYSGVTNNAKKTADSEIITQLNVQMRAQGVYGKNVTCRDAYDDAYEIGFDLAKMTPSYGDHYVWDQEHDLFAVTKGDEIVAQDKTESLTTDISKRWVFNKVISSAEERSQFACAQTYDTVTVSSGFDSGISDFIDTVKVVDNDVAKNIMVNTTNPATKIVVLASKSTITHHGQNGSTDLIATSKKSYHEEGKSAFIEIAKGRIVLGANSDVDQIHFDTKVNEYDLETGVKTKASDVFDEIIINVESGAQLPEFSRDEVQITNIGEDGILVVEVEKGNNQSDYIYLYQQGIVEQTKVTSGESSSPKAVDEDAINGDEAEGNTGEIAYDISNFYQGKAPGTYELPENAVNEDGSLKEPNDASDAGLSEQKLEEAKEEQVEKYALVLDDEMQIGDGESVYITNGEKFEWTIDEDGKDVVSISNGYITALDVGTATVHASGKTCEITVTPFHEDIEEFEDPFVIANEKQFENYLNYLVYDGYTYLSWKSWGYDYTTTVELISDIDMSKVTYANSCTGCKKYVFNGNGHTISNGTKPLFNCTWFAGTVLIEDLTLANFDSKHGLFTIYGGYDMNLTFDNVDIVNCAAHGGCAYVPYVYYSSDIVSFTNCDITNCTINDNNGAQGFVGAFVGNSKNGVTIDSCTVSDTVVEASSFGCGGLIGSSSGTIKNCVVKSTTTIEQKGSSSVAILGGGTRTNNHCYATIKSASKSQAYLQDTEGVWISLNPIAVADDFTLNQDGSITYTGDENLAKIKVVEKYSVNHLLDGEYDPNSCGYQNFVDESPREFTDITTQENIADAYSYVSNVRHVGATHTEKLQFNLAELPAGLEFNSKEVAFKDGILYLDSSISESGYENVYNNCMVGESGQITMYINIAIYDAYDELLTNVSLSYSFQAAE